MSPCHFAITLCDSFCKQSKKRSRCWLFTWLTPVVCMRTCVCVCCCRLCPANEVVTVSAAGSRLLGRIDTHKLRFAHPHLATDVAAWLGCAPIQVQGHTQHMPHIHQQGMRPTGSTSCMPCVCCMLLSLCAGDGRGGTGPFPALATC